VLAAMEPLAEVSSPPIAPAQEPPRKRSWFRAA